MRMLKIKLLREFYQNHTPSNKKLMTINHLVLKLFSPNYFKYLSQVNEYENNKFINHDKIQHHKLKLLLKHCVNNVPFYKGYSSKISDYPLITKEIINKNFNSFKAKNLSANRFKPNSTSGSTGQNFHFFSDNYTDFNRHAFANIGAKWAGGGFGEKTFLFWGADRDIINKGLKSKLANSRLLFNTLTKSSYHLQKTDIVNDILPSIYSFNPKVLVGYPSSLKFVSEYMMTNKIKPNQALRGIISSGESLSINQREIIENAFQVKVFNRYGCRDVGPIAHECENQSGLHVFSSHVYVEIINEKGQHCQPGEIGEIVVTDLDNYVFPFVRYKIGDIGVWSSEKCNCGRDLPLLKNVVGRTFDLIIGTNGNRVPGNYFTLLRNKFKNIDQFQLVQNQIGEIELKLKLKDNNLINETLLKRTIKEKLGDDMIINITYVDKFILTKNGKFRWVVSKVNIYE